MFADNPIPMDTTNGRSGLFKSGDWYLLGVQSLTVLCLSTWGILSTVALLWFIDLILPIRMDPYEELLGADLTEHRIRHGQVGVSRAVSALRPFHRSNSIEEVGGIGVNTGHAILVDRLLKARISRSKSRGRLSNAFQTSAGHVRDSNGNGERKNDHRTFGQRGHGFLNKRPGNPTNELHRTINTITRRLEREGKFKNGTRSPTAFPGGGGLNSSREFEFRTPLEEHYNRKIENRTKSTNIPSTIQNGPDANNEFVTENLKKVKYEDLTVSDLENLGEIQSAEDRFRYKISEADYADDIKRANLTWIY